MSAVSDAIVAALDGGQFVSATFSSPQNRKAGQPERVSVRGVLVRGSSLLQFETRVGNRALHKNLPFPEALGEMTRLLEETFRQAALTTTIAESRISINRKRELVVRTSAIERRPPAVEHNRRKSYIIPEGSHCEFLARLGVMTADGKVVASRYDKFRQINRFLEMVSDVIDEFQPGKPLHVVDFGCGKSYLTFALYYYLHDLLERQTRIVGLDIKEDVVSHCERLARELKFEGLEFKLGEIGSFSELTGADMVVSLHACDTATDDALAAAVSAGTRVILAVPCCQHELFGQIRSEVFSPMLRHGILKDRLTALVTDTLRAEQLEMAGYAVQVLEFIDMEHTPKNILIRAVRRPDRSSRPMANEEYARLRDFLHVSPHIETAMAARSIPQHQS